MTITELIENFQTALVGLIPAAEHLAIPWRRPDAYDEWDSLASAAYTCFVVTPCRWSQPEPERERFRLPPYDLLLESYAGHSLIEVVSEQSPDVIRVFHALGTTSSPFDTIEWRRIASSGAPLSAGLESCPLRGAHLALRVESPNGNVMHLRDLATR